MHLLQECLDLHGASAPCTLLNPDLARSLANEAPASAAVARPAEAARSLKVLLAEDNQINAVLATTLIRRAGHQVDVAPNGEEAVRSAAAGDYDVIFMDMHMPVMDGLEASRRIRALASSAGKLPIIPLTANATATDRQRCMAAGMNDFPVEAVRSERLEPDADEMGAGVAALVAAS